MQTVEQFIDALGGTVAVANALGLAPTTVSSWKPANSIPKWRVDALRAFAAGKGNTIMADVSTIVRERQAFIRREIDRRGIALKAVSMDSKIPYPTLLSYFPQEGSREPAMMPVSALYALIGALPDDLLSLLLPAGHVIVAVPEDVDHDEIARHCREYLRAKDDAHHPESEAGREIGPTEDNVLRASFARVKAA